MASGWAAEGAVQEQIDSTVNDGIERVRQLMGKGESARECELCGEPIPEARRQALKGVNYFVACQKKIDKQQQSTSLYNRRGSKDSQLRYPSGAWHRQAAANKPCQKPYTRHNDGDRKQNSNSHNLPAANSDFRGCDLIMRSAIRRGGFSAE